jgi:hypothetical protein
MNTENSLAADASVKEKPLRRWIIYIAILLSVPIFYFANKPLLAFYYGDTIGMYEDYGPRNNAVLTLIETGCVLFLLRFSKRRWYQFSLRTLLVVVTLFAVFCSCYAARFRQAVSQRKAVEAIRRLGGRIYYDYEMELVGDWYGVRLDTDEEAEKRIASPIGRLLGRDFYFPVACAICTGPEFTDAIMGPLRSLTHLTKLDLTQTRVSDSGLKHLGEMPGLKFLILQGTPIGDDGLQCLNGMRHLQQLDLSGTNVTDKGLQHTVVLTKLRELNLNDTKITDAGLVHCMNLAELKTISLAGTDITDAGLANIKVLSRLRFIDLSRTRVTSAGIKDLQNALPRSEIY